MCVTILSGLTCNAMLRTRGLSTHLEKNKIKHTFSCVVFSQPQLLLNYSSYQYKDGINVEFFQAGKDAVNPICMQLSFVHWLWIV